MERALTKTGSTATGNGYSLHEWREGLIRPGIPRPLAQAGADRTGWHQVATLVRRSCPPQFALRIAG